MLHRRKEEALRLVAGSLLTHYSVTSGTRGCHRGSAGVRVPPSHQQSDKASAEHMVRAGVLQWLQCSLAVILGTRNAWASLTNKLA